MNPNRTFHPTRPAFVGVLACLLLASHAHAGSAESTPSNPLSAASSATRTSDSRDSVEAEILRWTERTGDQPTDPEGWVRLGDAWMQKARALPESASYERAEAAYRRALTLDPRRTGAMVGLAWVFNTRHEFESGRRWAREALALDAGLPEAHALLGDAAVEAGDYDEAMDHYQASLDLRPDLMSYARAAHVLWITGDARRARNLMQRAIAAGGPHAENTAWCRAELAQMHFHDGAYLAAEPLAALAEKEAPAHAHILGIRARIQVALGNTAEAIRTYERALVRGPNFRAMAALVDLYAIHGDSGKSSQMQERLLDVYGDHGHTHLGADGKEYTHHHSHEESGNAELALFLANHDLDLGRALREAESAYAQFKGVAVADALAWCQFKNGKVQEAVRTIRRALKIGTPDASIHYHAGAIFARAGDRAAAQRHLYQALSLNPRFDPVHAPEAARLLRELSARPGGGE